MPKHTVCEFCVRSVNKIAIKFEEHKNELLWKNFYFSDQ